MERSSIAEFVGDNIEDIFTGKVRFNKKAISFKGVLNAGTKIRNYSIQLITGRDAGIETNAKIDLITNGYTFLNDLFVTMERNHEQYFHNSNNSNLNDLLGIGSTAATLAFDIYKLYAQTREENTREIRIQWLQNAIDLNTAALMYSNEWEGDRLQYPHFNTDAFINIHTQLSEQHRLMFKLTKQSESLISARSQIETGFEWINDLPEGKLDARTLFNAHKTASKIYKQVSRSNPNDYEAIREWHVHSFNAYNNSDRNNVRVEWLIESLDAAASLVLFDGNRAEAKLNTETIIATLTELRRVNAKLGVKLISDEQTRVINEKYRAIMQSK